MSFPSVVSGSVGPVAAERSPFGALEAMPGLLAPQQVNRLRSPLRRVLGLAGIRRSDCCAACGSSLSEGDGSMPYRGAYYHAGPCEELGAR